MTSAQCPVCQEMLVQGIRPWHLICQSCNYEGSDLEPHIAGTPDDLRLDEKSRENALVTLRKRNFQRIATEISRLVGKRNDDSRPRLLDVGCAHGWFLQACQRDFDITGIEPDDLIARAASERIGPIRHGFFPDVLLPEEKFDVITFNDVLEHIPDVESVLQSCNRHLSSGGWLLVNAPNRLGTIYRIAKLFARVGRPSSFDRMWQLGFPSPHVHYFDTNVMRKLGAAANFELVESSSLPSVVAHGLYSRVRYSRKVSHLKALSTAAIITLAIPLLSISPPDITIWYLRKRDGLR